MFKQRTVKNPSSILGKGLHSGKKVTMRVKPAPPNSGIIFVRVDLPGKPTVKVEPDNVADGMLATTLRCGEAEVKTVEHFLSALYALGIDNLIVELNASELPIMDGSTRPFIYFLRKDAGVKDQKAIKKFYRIIKSVEVSNGDKYIRVDPVDDPILTIDFTISFPHRLLENQHRFFEFTSQNYVDEISKARTFGFESDIRMLRKNGLALGGSLENAVVIGDFGVLNPEGLRYEDEFVRHKILDMIGDLYLLGHPIFGKVTAIKAGHALNHELVHKIVKEKAYEVVTLPLERGEKIFNVRIEPALSAE